MMHDSRFFPSSSTSSTLTPSTGLAMRMGTLMRSPRFSIGVDTTRRTHVSMGSIRWADCRLVLYGGQLSFLSPPFYLPWIINGMLITIATVNSRTTSPATTLLESLRVIRRPTTLVVISHSQDQQRQRRAVCRARQSASPIQTDRQG